MERLMTGGADVRLLRPLWQARRAVRMLARRTGVFWPGLLVCAVLTGAGLATGHDQAERAAMLAARPAPAMVTVAHTPAPDTAAAGQAGARARLRAFETHLLAHDAIPFAVQDLLDLGAAEGLSLQRGSYKPQADGAGQFLRYRITLPVQGSAQAVQRFMQVALRTQKNLALDGVQFKRARIGSPDIEARIDWVLLVALPRGAQ